ncbi:MAG: class I SAM-dependent methyltransferase [Phycisphaerae bacterium]|nr:class I SAM-dependent methyltransferase [Phycisphaerae bacterium]
MRPDQFSCFIDPETRVPLRLDQPSIVDGQVVSGALVDPSGGERFRIRNGIARFVPSTNYVQNFGLQWKIHSRTQLDSHNGSTYSRDRWKEVSGWDDDLRGKNILEAGSGAGRFTEVLASTGADVYSFDFSEAVEANRENNGHFPNLNVFQADVYRIPLAKGSFDHVFCLGVIQHTPDPALTFQCLASMLKPGGRLASTCT